MRDETAERLYYLSNDLDYLWRIRMKPADVFKNEFLTDLKTDYIAVAANGTPIARSTDLASVKRAAPDATAYFTGADFDTNVVNIRATGTSAGAATQADPRIFGEGVIAAMPIGDHTDTPKPTGVAQPLGARTDTPHPNETFDDKVAAILAAKSAAAKEAASLPDGTEPPRAA